MNRGEWIERHRATGIGAIGAGETVAVATDRNASGAIGLDTGRSSAATREDGAGRGIELVADYADQIRIGFLIARLMDRLLSEQAAHLAAASPLTVNTGAAHHESKGRTEEGKVTNEDGGGHLAPPSDRTCRLNRNVEIADRLSVALDENGGDTAPIGTPGHSARLRKQFYAPVQADRCGCADVRICQGRGQPRHAAAASVFPVDGDGKGRAGSSGSPVFQSTATFFIFAASFK